MGGPWRPLLLSLRRLIRTSRKFTRPAADAAARIAVAFAARNIAASVAAARNDARCLCLSTCVCLPVSVYLGLSTWVCLPGPVSSSATSLLEESALGMLRSGLPPRLAELTLDDAWWVTSVFVCSAAAQRRCAAQVACWPRQLPQVLLSKSLCSMPVHT